jgi:hypothetical protein
MSICMLIESHAPDVSVSSYARRQAARMEHHRAVLLKWAREHVKERVQVRGEAAKNSIARGRGKGLGILYGKGKTPGPRYQGAPCRNGGHTERYAKNDKCVECERQCRAAKKQARLEEAALL